MQQQQQQAVNKPLPPICRPGEHMLQSAQPHPQSLCSSSTTVLNAVSSTLPPRHPPPVDTARHCPIFDSDSVNNLFVYFPQAPPITSRPVPSDHNIQRRDRPPPSTSQLVRTARPVFHPVRCPIEALLRRLILRPMSEVAALDGPACLTIKRGLWMEDAAAAEWVLLT